MQARLFPIFLVTLFGCGCCAQQISPSVVGPEIVQSRAAEKAAATGATNCDRACGKIASSLPHLLYLGKEGNHVFWDEKVRELDTACRVEPSTTEEVVAIYKTLKAEQCHFGIKSGGHSQQPGASNTDGVVIDLVKLDDLELSKNKKSLRVGPGRRWKDAYQYLEPEGLYVVGGRVADVGVGGLLLGGGLSFHTGKSGFAVDHIIDMTVVLPSGEAVTASKKSHPDLFKALKGAGQNNFGIVTSFTLDVYPLHNRNGVWRRKAVYGWDKLPEVTSAHAKYVGELLDAEAHSTCEFLTWVWSPQYGKMISADQFHVAHTDAATVPKAFAHFRDIEHAPHTEAMQVMPISNITIELELPNPYGMRNAYASFSYQPDAAVDLKIAKLFEEAVHALDGVETWGWALVQQPVSKQALEAGDGGNALGLSPSQGPMINLLLPWAWMHKVDDERVRKVQQELLEKAEEVAKAAGKWVPFRYINYAESWQKPSPYESYGHYEWLKDVQRKYDPEGVYTKEGLARGWFKLNEDKPDGKRKKDEL